MNILQCLGTSFFATVIIILFAVLIQGLSGAIDNIPDILKICIMVIVWNALFLYIILAIIRGGN